MDLNVVNINSIRSSSPRARSISPQRRDQYRQEGKCVRCGSQDHWVKDCLLQPFTARQRRELQLANESKVIGTNPGRVVISALYDDAYDEWPDSDDPDHPDAWQKGIFPT